MMLVISYIYDIELHYMFRVKYIFIYFTLGSFLYWITGLFKDAQGV